MAIPGPGYSITARVEAPAAPHTTGALARAVSDAGGSLTALDVAESRADRIVVDVTCDALDADHAVAIEKALGEVAGVEVRKISDRTFLLHLGGKLEVRPRVPLRHRDDLSRAAPDLLTGDDIATMAADAIVFALANPDPEVDPVAAGDHAAIVATGRSDYPNQINNVLAFPGFFRGMLDAGAYQITDEAMLAAATAIADAVAPRELNASYSVPSVFDAAVAPAVAAAVREAVSPDRTGPRS